MSTGKAGVVGGYLSLVTRLTSTGTVLTDVDGDPLCLLNCTSEAVADIAGGLDDLTDKHRCGGDSS